MTESRALIVTDQDDKPHPDPVIEGKRVSVKRMIDLHARGFKRVDIQLLQMRSPYGSTLPVFAVQSLDSYERHLPANIQPDHHNVDGRQVFRDIMVGQGFTAATATPKGSIPQSAKAIVSQVGREFDNLFVVWDASREWSVAIVPAEAAMAGADPLILGDVDGVWFCVAKWDLTKLESYFLE